MWKSNYLQCNEGPSLLKVFPVVLRLDVVAGEENERNHENEDQACVYNQFDNCPLEMFCRTGYERRLGRREDEDPSDGRDEGNDQEGTQDEDVLH